MVFVLLAVSAFAQPSDASGVHSISGLGGLVVPTALALLWLAAIIYTVVRAPRDAVTATAALGSSIGGLVFFPWWAQLVGAPTAGGVSPSELMELLFPFLGISVPIGVTIVSAIVLAMTLLVCKVRPHLGRAVL